MHDESYEYNSINKFLFYFEFYSIAEKCVFQFFQLLFFFDEADKAENSSDTKYSVQFNFHCYRFVALSSDKQLIE